MPDPSIAPFARTAYAHGWAASGGPMTDRVKAGCIAAVELAIAHADDPHILEATLHLGHLEGVWALVFERRDQVHAANLATVHKAWAPLVAELPIDDLVRRWRLERGLTEAVDPQLIADAIAILGQWLQELVDLTGWAKLRKALAAAIAAAKAEGAAGAIALAAADVEQLTATFDVIFDDALAALADIDGLLGEADTWVADLLGNVAHDAARLLARLTEEGATYAQMRDQLGDLLASDDLFGLDLTINLLTGRGLTLGALDLYAREGVTEVDFITAGDARVDQQCADAEDNGPYALLDAPIPPLHPFCVVGSTRVSVPRLVVPVDEPQGNTPLLPALASRDTGHRGASPAAAVAEAEGDFGRRNIRAVTVREYVGQLITIRTALGHELTGTPNHPIATRSGWVALAELAVGDDVLSSAGAEWEILAIDPDVNQVPPRIEDVAHTFPVRLGPMPTAPEYFHGDGAGSNVHVVRTDRLLRYDGSPQVDQHSDELLLGEGNGEAVQASGLDEQSLSVPLLRADDTTADSLVGGGRQPRPFLWSRSGHPLVHRGAASSDRHLGDFQVPPDDAPADAEGFCERLLALASDIALDQIVSVDRDVVSTHVYNLDTVDGWYIGNGIVTHNCRCSLAASSPQLDDLLAAYLNDDVSLE